MRRRKSSNAFLARCPNGDIEVAVPLLRVTSPYLPATEIPSATVLPEAAAPFLPISSCAGLGHPVRFRCNLREPFLGLQRPYW